jgi:hypothetical protein
MWTALCWVSSCHNISGFKYMRSIDCLGYWDMYTELVLYIYILDDTSVEVWW